MVPQQRMYQSVAQNPRGIYLEESSSSSSGYEDGHLSIFGPFKVIAKSPSTVLENLS